jgi:hypothetical protein
MMGTKGITRLGVGLYLLGVGTIIFNGVRPFLLIPLSDWFFFAAIGLMALIGIWNRQRVSEWMPFHLFWIPALLILAGGLLSSPGAVQPGNSVMVSLKVAFLFSIWMGAGIAVARRELMGRWVLVAFIAGAVFTSIVAIWDFLTGMNIGPSFYLLDPAVSGLDPLGYQTTQHRFCGTMGQPNQLGELTAVAFPIALHMAWVQWENREGWIKKLAGSGASILILWANLLTGSVAGLLGLGIGAMSLVIARIIRDGRVRYWLTRALILIGAAVAILLLTIWTKPDIGFADRITANFSRALFVSGPDRWNVNLEAITRIAAKPWIGYGMDQGNVNPNTIQLVTSTGVHNTILEAWLGGGILAFLGVILLYGQTIRLALLGFKAAIHKTGSPYLLGLAASIAGWICIDMTQPSIYLRYTWITVAVLSGLLTADRSPSSQGGMDRVAEQG